jgi:hypothetical protein
MYSRILRALPSPKSRASSADWTVVLCAFACFTDSGHRSCSRVQPARHSRVRSRSHALRRWLHRKPAVSATRRDRRLAMRTAAGNGGDPSRVAASSRRVKALNARGRLVRPLRCNRSSAGALGPRRPPHDEPAFIRADRGGGVSDPGPSRTRAAPDRRQQSSPRSRERRLPVGAARIRASAAVGAGELTPRRCTPRDRRRRARRR